MKFVMDFVARIRGQSLTTVIERAIQDAAESASYDEPSSGQGHPKRWVDFWDPSEGVRTLRLLADMAYPSTFDEDQIREFTLAHWPFFYEAADGATPCRLYVGILWPAIDGFLEFWRDHRSTKHWAAGQIMAEHLKNSGVEPPQWPPARENSKPVLVEGQQAQP